jgi:hypothetical protein
MTDVHALVKAFLLDELEENGGSERAKREVTKRRHVVAKCLLLFDGFLSVLRTEHQDDQKQGQKTQHLHQMGAVEWEQSCPEDTKGSGNCRQQLF